MNYPFVGTGKIIAPDNSFLARSVRGHGSIVPTVPTAPDVPTAFGTATATAD